MKNAGHFTLICLFLMGWVAVGHTGEREIQKGNVEAQVDLKNLFSLCNYFWAREGSNQNCEMKTRSDPEYFFQHSRGITITIVNGKSDEFMAKASHADGDKVYTLDESGNITEEPK